MIFQPHILIYMNNCTDNRQASPVSSLPYLLGRYGAATCFLQNQILKEVRNQDLLLVGGLCLTCIEPEEWTTEELKRWLRAVSIRAVIMKLVYDGANCL